MMLVTISIAIILNPTFVTAQSCPDPSDSCALIHEDAWIPMQNAYQQIKDDISDHDDDIKQALFQHHTAINAAIGNIGNIGDIIQHDADIKVAITSDLDSDINDHDAAVTQHVADIKADITAHDGKLDGAISTIDDIEADINSHDIAIKAAISDLDSDINDHDAAVTQHVADIQSSITAHDGKLDGAIST
eukprot:815963_1